jgi:chromosome segregation ATPase
MKEQFDKIISGIDKIISGIESTKLKYEVSKSWLEHPEFCQDYIIAPLTDKDKDILALASNEFDAAYENIMNTAPEIKSSLEMNPDHLANTNRAIDELQTKIDEIEACQNKLNDLPDNDARKSLIKELDAEKNKLNDVLLDLETKKKSLEEHCKTMQDLLNEIKFEAPEYTNKIEKKTILEWISKKSKMMHSISEKFKLLSESASKLHSIFTNLGTLIPKAKITIQAAEGTLAKANDFLSKINTDASSFNNSFR